MGKGSGALGIGGYELNAQGTNFCPATVHHSLMQG